MKFSDTVGASVDTTTAQFLAYWASFFEGNYAMFFLHLFSTLLTKYVRATAALHGLLPQISAAMA